MIKSSLDLPGYTNRPSYNIIMNDKDRDRIEKEVGYKFVIIGEMENIEHILCTVFHARSIIFSWGTLNWCNRIWVHPDAQVLLLSPKYYEHEYTWIAVWQLNLCRHFRVWLYFEQDCDILLLIDVIKKLCM
jgi:hypothetical protein